MNKEFKLTQVKLTEYFRNDGSRNVNQTLNISAEVKQAIEEKSGLLKWQLFVNHSFYDENMELVNTGYTIPLEDNFIDKLADYDLRLLQNNYFPEDDSEVRWEINYNEYFFIVGSKFNEIREYAYLKGILCFDDIIKKELTRFEN